MNQPRPLFKGTFMLLALGMQLSLALAVVARTPLSQDTSGLPSHQYLPEITVVGKNLSQDIHQLPEIVGTSIYAGKKNALVVLDHVKGNIVTNTMRQVVAKVPGVHIWESDGSGIQIGISARGLSPNRSWEFNVRQNGYDIAADPFGYPEAYYNPQLQAVQRIEIVRGQGSLQYGPQFGGMINYILRNGSDIEKPLQLETQQTLGSFGLFNSFNAIGGTKGKVHYYTFFDHRRADGWRPHSAYFTNSALGTFTWKPAPKWSLTAELMYSHIRSQQPGGLTDIDFREDAQQSLRSRNWMDIRWITAAVIGNYRFSTSGRVNLKLFTVRGDRTSLGFLKPITVPDTVNRITGTYLPRTLDQDLYRNLGFEARVLQDFQWNHRKQTFSGGIRLYHGNTFRFRDGKGTTGEGYTKERTDPVWPRDLDFRSRNAALFIEQLFRLTEKWSLIPGIRYEFLLGQASGIAGYDSTGKPILLQPQQRQRGFVLGGVGSEWHVSPGTEVYANITQAYRPIQFADLTAPPTTDVVDPNIRDARGYNLDLGYRGKLRDILSFDVSVFLLKYNQRVGVLTQQRADGSFYNLRTNVGNSTSKGLEAFAEWRLKPQLQTEGRHLDLRWYISYGFTSARYGEFQVITKNSNNQLDVLNLRNRKVENAPEHILRSGFTIGYRNTSFTSQFSAVSGTFSDANNTYAASPNGQQGWIPGYRILDFTLQVNFTEQLSLRCGINNATDARYFTRRASGYPGPGLMPADGRSFFVTLGFKG